MNYTDILDDYKQLDETKNPFLHRGVLPEQLLWTGKPRLFWTLQWYNLILSPLMLFIGLMFAWIVIHSYLNDGSFAFVSFFFGVFFLYYSLPFYLRDYWIRKNTYYALTPTHILRIQGNKWDEFDLMHIRNVVYVPTIAHFGNVGFLYPQGGSWKNQSLKELSYGDYLYQKLMNQLDTLANAE